MLIMHLYILVAVFVFSGIDLLGIVPTVPVRDTRIAWVSLAASSSAIVQHWRLNSGKSVDAVRRPIIDRCAADRLAPL